MLNDGGGRRGTRLEARAEWRRRRLLGVKSAIVPGQGRRLARWRKVRWLVYEVRLLQLPLQLVALALNLPESLVLDETVALVEVPLHALERCP